MKTLRTSKLAPLAAAALVQLVAASAFAEPAAAPPPVEAPSATAAAPAASTSTSPAPAAAPDADPWYRVRPQVELGLLGVVAHHVQFGKNGTYFDYRRDGGQDTLSFFVRMGIDLEINRRHNVTFLYQPLEINSRAQLPNDLVVDEARFVKGTPMAFKYGFPFYRLSYMYDLLPDDRRELSFGVSGQIRNATIEFATVDGATLKSYRNIGFVPLLKSRGRYAFDNGMFVGHEIDGIYAPIRGVNGSDNEVTGALVDASLRVGVALPRKSEAFLNVRYLAGGATGQSDPEPFSDGRTKNWLHFVTVSVGGTISSF